MKKSALITGINGQDGAYLARLLVLAIASLMLVASGVARASETTTETILLIGTRDWPENNEPADSDDPTTSSILLLDKKIYPLETTTTMKVQGERWLFKYRLDRQKDTFISDLKIIDSKGVVLWEDKWGSGWGDLYDLLTSAETANTQQWVKGYFGRKFHYGPHLEIRQIKKNELVPELVEWSTSKVGMDNEALAKRLTNGSRLVVFDYRTTWRENMTVMAFIPEIRKFAVYSNGGY